MVASVNHTRATVRMPKVIVETAKKGQAAAEAWYVNRVSSSCGFMFVVGFSKSMSEYRLLNRNKKREREV